MGRRPYKKAQIFTADEIAKKGMTISDASPGGRTRVFLFYHLGYYHMQERDAGGNTIKAESWDAKLPGIFTDVKRWYRAATGQPHVDVEGRAVPGIKM